MYYYRLYHKSCQAYLGFQTSKPYNGQSPLVGLLFRQFCIFSFQAFSHRTYSTIPLTFEKKIQTYSKSESPFSLFCLLRIKCKLT